MDIEMSETLIKDIANAVVNQSIFHNWKFYALILVLSIIGSYISNFIKSYSGKRGETLATKSDFEEILKQQQKMTEITESIKKSVDLSHWKQKEYELIKRQKIEQILLLIYKYQDWLYKEVQDKLLTIKENLEPDPYNQIMMIYKLYLPEINDEMDTFINARTEFYGWLVLGMKEVGKNISGTNLKPMASEKHMDKFANYYEPIADAIEEVENKCKEVMEKIICT